MSDKYRLIQLNVYGAIGACILALIFFAIALGFDAWSASKDHTAHLGIFQICYSINTTATRAATQCATIDWGCSATRCSRQRLSDGTPAQCQTWEIFEPGGFDTATLSRSQIPGNFFVPFSNPQLQFPGEGRCGAFDTMRVLLLVSWLGIGAMILLLIESVADPCHNLDPTHYCAAEHTEEKASPLLMGIAAITGVLAFLSYVISILVFLFDVYDPLTSKIGISLILAALAAAMILVAAVLIFRALKILAIKLREDEASNQDDIGSSKPVSRNKQEGQPSPATFPRAGQRQLQNPGTGGSGSVTINPGQIKTSRMANSRAPSTVHHQTAAGATVAMSEIRGMELVSSVDAKTNRRCQSIYRNLSHDMTAENSRLHKSLAGRSAEGLQTGFVDAMAAYAPPGDQTRQEKTSRNQHHYKPVRFGQMPRSLLKQDHHESPSILQQS